MKRSLQFACIAALAIACNGIRAAPIYDDEDLDAGPDAAADAAVEASTCATTAPATCGHDPTLPGPTDAGGPSCVTSARLLQCPANGNATVTCESDAGTCPSATGVCKDLCCADEYVTDCSSSFVAPAACRALPPNPGGFSRMYCCKCQ